MDVKRVAIAVAAAAILTIQGLSAQVVFTPARIQKAKASVVAEEIAAVPPMWSAEVEESIIALVAKSKAEGSLAFVNAAIVEKARAGEASLPELLFLIVSGAYGPLEMDIARGALAIAARDAGLEAAAAMYLVQLLQDNYGMSIAYRMPTLEQHGIRTIDDLKARWAEVERLLADGEDAKRWITRLTSAEEFDYALKMLDLAVKGKLVDAGYERMMRAGIKRLADAARKGSRKLAHVLGTTDELSSSESWQSLAVSADSRVVGVWRADLGTYMIANGVEYGPGSGMDISRASAGKEWIASLSAMDDGPEWTVTVDSRGLVREGDELVGSYFSAEGGGIAADLRSGQGTGALDLGDGRKLEYGYASPSVYLRVYDHNYTGEKETRTASDGSTEIKVGAEYYGPVADADVPRSSLSHSSVWIERPDGTEWVLIDGQFYGPYETASSPDYFGEVPYYAFVQDGLLGFSIGGKTIGPFDADAQESAVLSFSADGSAWSASVPFGDGVWVLFDEKGAATSSQGRPFVAYRDDLSRVAAVVDEEGFVAFTDSLSETELAIKGDAVDAIWISADASEWWAMVQGGGLRRLIDGSGSDMGLYLGDSRDIKAEIEAASLLYFQLDEDSPINISRRDGTEVAMASWIADFTVSPEGGAWALVYGDQDWNLVLAFSDGTKMSSWDSLSVGFASDTAWWAFDGEKLISSSGETIENVMDPSIDRARKTISWFEIQDDRIYAVSRKF
ncbi:MAG: hypothetical protein Q8M76_19295 [Spirochaetaceae bacterium]|nr:hypothetical protein [Spirochaetaceae bacterium]